MIVDNASQDDTASIVRAAGYELVTLDSNRGYAAAINCGTRRFPHTRSILVLNADIELTPGSVAVMLDVLRDDRVGIVAPKTFIPGGPSTLDLTQRRDPSLSRTWGVAFLGVRFAKHSPAMSEIVSDPMAYEAEVDVDWAVGAALLCSRNCVDAVGDWDESYFLYSEEIDYCRRVRDAGFAVRYTPDAVVFHRGGEATENPRLRAMLAINRVREFRRRHGATRAWCFFAGILFHELIRGLAGHAAARSAVVALVSPRRRPPEVRASASLMPR